MNAVYIVSCLFDAFVIFLLFESFFDKRRKGISIPWIVLGLVLGQVLTTVVSVRSEHLLVRLVVQLACSFFIAMLYEGTTIKRIWATVIFVAFAVISEGLAEWGAALMNIPEGKETDIILLFLVEIFMLILVLLTKLFKKNEGTVPKKYQLGYFLVPIFSIIIIYGMANSEPTVSWFVSLVCLLLLNMVCYYLLNTFTGYVMRENEKNQMEQQMERQKEKYEQLSSSFVRGNRLIHDINKHHRALKEYLSHSETEQALEYIEKMDHSFENLYSSVNTGNLVIDSVLSYFKERLKQMKCQDSVSVAIDKNRKIMDDYDLVIVLGNITDNIVESLSYKGESDIGFAEIKRSMNKNALMSYSKKRVFRCGKKKKNKWYHGFGMNNVRDTLEKYGGTMVINEQTDFYETMIQIPLGGNETC